GAPLWWKAIVMVAFPVNGRVLPGPLVYAWDWRGVAGALASPAAPIGRDIRRWLLQGQFASEQQVARGARERLGDESGELIAAASHEYLNSARARSDGGGDIIGFVTKWDDEVHINA